MEVKQHALQKASQMIWSCEKYAKDAGDKLEHMKKQYVSMEKALSQTQQEADTNACATQDAVYAKAAVHDQVKPIVDLAMHAANNVHNAILAAHAQEPQEAVAKLVSEAQDALAHAKNLSYEYLKKKCHHFLQFAVLPLRCSGGTYQENYGRSTWYTYMVHMVHGSQNNRANIN